ncbi:3-hydroxyacyl-CoA dehydrogenase/enoyl-CoA hydratase/3-hydroxybutyryl-CoA epimerase [Caulobacter rhizosphaerae]|jgi:3-hydroxyacyl-CoA dehydrogenase/enoyl-CoA hydratase/3-hydroxybutyryl-CoA epimerase|uniref:3-hydroxyacyl-CoA dehydrogenase/enoyl-CoA hydratase/3-hydroxybutyryl-CoA epimerase n=1 Tax=Caulobacter rhizosphaerae TaxID=2010972 RepID=A0ABU1MXU2_9CAUL|nr:3-hydroxyacyl-CoA dehydrogenase NAD-binding domain-containing protein [Caulobacter rhizosphaerae]MDR6530857.1 3-hydroxyacyl-CoA dehydrogenase/enoyl-CoA hydratase/3-hydroxybutyryl-CoA epimerase [Caulobacter rhizosphaerae]
MENFKIEVDGDGIALVTFDVPGRSMNTLTASVIREIGEVVETLKSDAAIKGAVITSGKTTGFCAGADLGELGGAEGGFGSGDLKAAFDAGFALNKAFRALETGGKPIAAAINGLAMGGGLEMTLACHYRVVADSPKIQLSLPEAKVGLLPGGGGTQRLTRLMGVMAAAPFLLEGKSMKPAEALGFKVVHEVVPADQVVEAAKTWVKTKGDAVAPWDKKDFKIPGGGPYTASGSQVFIMGNAMLRKQTYGNYPAQLNIMKAVYEGLQVPFDAAIRIETRYFLKTLMSPQAKGMIRTLFLSLQELGKGSGRPAGVPHYDVKKVAVLGAGMMGAGIAYVQAMAGIETVLIDQTQEAADKGKGYAEGLVKKAVSRGKMTQEKGEAILALIHPTADYASVKGSDLVVEAVFENRDVKAEVTRKAEAQLADTAIFGSNTSTLPITGLAKASVRPASFIGIHFFSPVDKMGLVELIMGQETSQEALAKSIDYVLKIKKTPIVVNDSRGFYTSRCFGTFVQEGMELLSDGYAPAIIDNVGRATGMPRGPLEMHDDVALDLSYKIAQQTKKDLGDKYEERPFTTIIEKMVEGEGRYGRKNGKGFYDYPESGPKVLWKGLSDLAPVRIAEVDKVGIEEIRTRLLYRQAVEAARCFEEGVITDPREADVGAILGWGFAPWTGGPISLIDGLGAAEFVKACDALAQKHGARFSPPQLLRDMAAKGETFYGRFGAKERAAA